MIFINAEFVFHAMSLIPLETCRIMVTEIQDHLEFDIDSNGEVSMEEATVNIQINLMNC